MSLGLSFDSKPTKVPKKVIICLNISLIKPCDLKSAREYRKVKESSHTGSVLPVTEQGGDGAAQRTQSLQSPSDASCHLVPVGPSAREADAHLRRLQPWAKPSPEKGSYDHTGPASLWETRYETRSSCPQHAHMLSILWGLYWQTTYGKAYTECPVPHGQFAFKHLPCSKSLNFLSKNV